DQPSIGLVGATGHSLPQFGIAVPGAPYGTLGVRLSLGAAAHGARQRMVTGNASTTSAPRLVVAPSRRLVITVPSAGRAEVMGDFTNWEVRALAPAGEGRWIFADPLTSGTHQLNVRFEDSLWVVPAGAVSVDDGFGGRTGLFVVQ